MSAENTLESEELNDQSLDECFNECEKIVEATVKSTLGADRNCKVELAIKKLQDLSQAVKRLELFSANDQIDDLPTSSLRYLLLPAYLAQVISDLTVEKCKRSTYLNAAKFQYREFLRVLSVYEVVSFKLPWVDADNEEKGKEHCAQSTSLTGQSKVQTLKEAISKRDDKITRIKRLSELEEALEKLRYHQKKNSDDATQRQIIFTLLRFWALRAVNELEIIDEELKILKFVEERKQNEGTENDKSTSALNVPLKPFIIARSEEQKKVFGLGYPSVPTVTVDEWYDEMMRNKGFGNMLSARNKSYQIGEGTNDKNFTNDEDEDDTEEKREQLIKRDEWRDSHRRGWGNTHNKG